MGHKLAKQLKANVGDMVTLLITTESGSINAADLELVGTFDSGVTEMDKHIFYVHNEMIRELLGITGTHRLLLGFAAEDERPYQAKLEKLLEKKYPQLEVVHWRELAEFFDNTMGWLKRQYSVFRIIVLLVATLSIINVFTMSLLERLGEFGIMRAMGTYRLEIACMIFMEAIFQAFFGSLLGVALGLLVIVGPLKGGITMPPPPLMSVEFLVEFIPPWNRIPGVMGLGSLDRRRSWDFSSNQNGKDQSSASLR